MNDDTFERDFQRLLLLDVLRTALDIKLHVEVFVAGVAIGTVFAERIIASLTETSNLLAKKHPRHCPCTHCRKSNWRNRGYRTY